MLYVHGNWDSNLEYDLELSPWLHHLHLEPFQCGEFTFVGFSGCPTHWGKNPIHMRLTIEAEAKHRATIEVIGREEESPAAASASASKECETRLSLLRSVARKRGRKPSKRAIQSILAKRDKIVSQIEWQKHALKTSPAYQAYLDDLANAWSGAMRENRRALASVIKERLLVPGRTIIVTHERLSNARSEFADAALFIFGHRHVFSNTTFRGSRYLNVAALDKRVLLEPIGRDVIIPKSLMPRPEASDEYFYRQSGWRNLNEGSYVTATWTSAHGFEATRVPLQLSPDWELYWRRVVGQQAPEAPLLPYG